MTFRVMVWREPGNYGAGGCFVPRKQIGDRTFPRAPELGDDLEINDEVWRVSEIFDGYIYVRPQRMKAL